MSRQSKSEYITVKRERYGCTKKRKTKSRIIDEVVETLGFERKYAIRLLTGNRTFRPHKGRGKTYSDEAIALLIDLWRRANEPNSKYFKAQMARLLRDLRAVRNVPERLAQELLRMSASTIERNLKGLARKPLGALRKTYRTKESKSLAFVEVGSGERIPACDVEPGDIQVDTAALCGGDLRDNFIWVLTLTDRRTQWTEIRAVWNIRHNGLTVRHRKALERRFRETNALLLFDQLSRSLTRLCRKQETHRLRQQAQADAPHLIEGAAHPLEHPAPLPPDTSPNTSPRPLPPSFSVQ